MSDLPQRHGQWKATPLSGVWGLGLPSLIRAIETNSTMKKKYLSRAAVAPRCLTVLGTVSYSKLCYTMTLFSDNAAIRHHIRFRKNKLQSYPVSKRCDQAMKDIEGLPMRTVTLHSCIISGLAKA